MFSSSLSATLRRRGGSNRQEAFKFSILLANSCYY
jgi:hypothetical protein